MLRSSGGVCSPTTSETETSDQFAGSMTEFPHFSTAIVTSVVYLRALFVDLDQRIDRMGGKLINHVYKRSRGIFSAALV